MKKKNLALISYIAIAMAGILFIPYSSYHTCTNTCVGNLCTMMYCPEYNLNIITAVGLTKVTVEMPNGGQFLLLVLKGVELSAAVYIATRIVGMFLPSSEKRKKK